MQWIIYCISFASDNLLELGIVKQLVRLLREPHDGSHEHMVNVLLSMVQGHQGLTMECKHEKYGLIELLKGRLGMLHGKEQYKVWKGKILTALR